MKKAGYQIEMFNKAGMVADDDIHTTHDSINTERRDRSIQTVKQTQLNTANRKVLKLL